MVNWPKLSNDELYDKMVKMREFQLSPQAMSAEDFRETDLWVEVRRRSKSDLFFSG